MKEKKKKMESCDTNKINPNLMLFIINLTPSCGVLLNPPPFFLDKPKNDQLFSRTIFALSGKMCKLHLQNGLGSPRHYAKLSKHLQRRH